MIRNLFLLRRSALIVPLSSERFIAKAHLRGADGITLDLEDGVAPSEKARARDRLPEAVRMVGRGGARVAVRINRPLDLAVRDIEAAVIPGVASLGIAKAENAAHIRLIAELVTKLEQERGLPSGGIRLTASVETPAALAHAWEIAAADPRLNGIGLGSEDLAAACGMEPTPEALFLPKQQVLFAAKAAGIQALGFIGSVADYTDLEGLRAVVRRSKQMGFRGGGVIHPAQISILNEEFSPSREEVARAQTIVEQAEAAFREGRGAFSFEGKMIDKPVVDRAEETLAFAAAVVRHEQQARALLDAEQPR